MHTYDIVRSPEGSGLLKWLVLIDGEPYVAWRTRRQARRCIRLHQAPVVIYL